ncbi:putative wall-associated receptor kinase-like 16 [Syzygium oleosum]|uniref:putative wall-associated receptor kinase-like 16 n=1 Tax=Syzygium oleosum TaxID=219896 RepID=UPI0011D1FE93|nr:putative wall-associated receptor kinase-like 16 [Syzygium oleosum]
MHMKRVEGRTMAIHKLLLKVALLGAFLFGPYHNHVAQADDSLTKPGCRSSCGNLLIPYPFGLTDSDSHCRINSSSFIVDCDYSTSPPVPYMWNRSSNIKILHISVEDHEQRISAPIARNCYNSCGCNDFSSWLRLAKFPLSSTKNKFTAIGCDTSASFRDRHEKFSFGCMSSCSSVLDVSNGSCTGIGCCETSIPRNSFSYNISITSFSNHSDVLDFNPCSYAFVAEIGSYNFSVGDLRQLKFNDHPLVLDWAIGNQTCEEAKKNSMSYMCTNNTICTDTENGSGYKCTCLEGYRGNPYLPNGCHDIDECADPEMNQCEKICHNVIGNYTCSCPKGYHGDGKKGGGDGQGCIANPSHLMKILVGVAVGIIVLLFSIGFLYFGYKKRKLIKFKEHYFKQNGGLLLQEQLHECDRTTKVVKLFSAEELEKATDNYDKSRIIGRGGYGTVYKGLLPNNTVVAIKKSRLVDQSQIEQFINEVIVLSQINNRNVVKLLGCCLETEVPLLVYEFVNNGTLFDHIHNKSLKLSWETRLRIASETAGVLSYLHSTAFTPIIHRDVKSANILLDANYTTKVSDFGASRLVPLDQTQLSTMVQGTLGYLDPEYFQTSQLTEKSDVYSFGVVLAELLTGKKALSFDRPEEQCCLATYFLSSLKNDKLFQIVDEVIANEENNEQVKEVANLSERCLKIEGKERPTMKEVAMELEGLRAMAKHPWVSGINVNPEETVHLPGEKTDVHIDSIVTTGTGYTENMKNHVMPLVSSGR